LKANKVNLFVSSVLFVFWYHSPNVLDTPHICNISWLRVKIRDYMSRQVANILFTEFLVSYLQIPGRGSGMGKLQDVVYRRWEKDHVCLRVLIPWKHFGKVGSL
jgi:hypothetical protein